MKTTTKLTIEEIIAIAEEEEQYDVAMADVQNPDEVIKANVITERKVETR